MNPEKNEDKAAAFALEYQLTINSGELNKAYEMILPGEKEVRNIKAFIKEKIGVDTLIENLKKFLPDVGKLEVISTVYDDSSEVYIVTLKQMFPDANIIGAVFSEVMMDFFGLSGKEFDEQKYKGKIKKAVLKRKKIFKNGTLLEVELITKVEQSKDRFYISPGWIEENRKYEEKQALSQKASALSTEVFKEQGSTGSIFKALEPFRALVKIDETYNEKYPDIEERAVIAKKISIKIIDPNPDSKSMVKVKITNNSSKKITSENYDCELFDDNKTSIYHEINQTWETLEPGASAETWAMFNSEAGARRKEVKLSIVNVTLR